MKKLLMIFGLLALVFHLGAAWAYSDQNDPYTLELKGFSPEIIKATEAMTDRMEGRQPPAVPNRKQQLFYNFKNNEWSESLKPFTYDTVEPPRYPLTP